MKQLIYILTLLILASCGQSKTEQKITTDADTISADKKADAKANLTEMKQHEAEKNLVNSLQGFEKLTLYKLTDTISADFNGDGIIDKAIYKKEINTSGIIIIHGKTNDEVRIGFGKEFAHLTEFNWVDYWGFVEDKVTSEVTFSEDGDVLGSKVVKLQNPSIALGANELGGGLITFMNGKYVWIHQTC